MSATLLSKSVFIHVPKTGGTWTCNVLKTMGLIEKKIRFHPHLDQIKEQWGNDLFFFAFVRHPLTWWQSLWSHRVRANWSRSDIKATKDLEEWLAPINELKDSDFNVFMRKVLQKHPGHYSNYFEQFTGVDNEVDYIGRFESLREDLVSALVSANESFSKSTIMSYEPIRQANKSHPKYDLELMKDVELAESKIIKRFYEEN